MDEKLRQLDATIFDHLQLRRSLLRQMQDAFTPLGEDAPYFRAIFAGVEPPVKDKDELIKKAGGPDRLITVSDPRYGEMTFALLDILEAVRDLEGYLPIDSLEAFVKQVKTGREAAKSGQGKFSFPGWGRVPTRNLQRILEQPKARMPEPTPRFKPGRRALPTTPCINARVLGNLAEGFKRKAEQVQAKGGNLEPGTAALTVSDIYAVVWEIMKDWGEIVVKACENEAQARLVDATNARQEAQAQANTAQNRRNQALAAATTAALCNFATQAK